MIYRCRVPSRGFHFFFGLFIIICCGTILRIGDFLVAYSMPFPPCCRGLLFHFIVFCSQNLVVCSTESLSLMSAVANVEVGADDVFWYSPPYSVEKSISRYVHRLDDHQFAVMPVGQTFTGNTYNKEYGTAYVRWRQRWKQTFTDMQFRRLFGRRATKQRWKRL